MNQKYIVKNYLIIFAFLQNIFLKKKKRKIIKLEKYHLKINECQQKLINEDKINKAKSVISKKVQENMNNFNRTSGKIEELKNYLYRLNNEIQHPSYLNIDKRYTNLKFQFMLATQTVKELEIYYEALDNSLIKYHGKRMEEINKLINYYWNMTYKGNDIKNIEITSDYQITGRSRNYNYRIVFTTNNGQVLDMRGRCSAGQKILASIIIRLALAETFCNNCGILCLDEPTTNLDELNSKSLSKALRELIQSRNEDKNFQLIIITHDPMFVDMLGNDFCDNFWQVEKNKDGYSTLSLKPINKIFEE